MTEPAAQPDPLTTLGEAFVLVGLIIVVEWARPQTRQDCAEAARPCPFAGCPANMMIDVTENGEIILNSGQVDAERGEGANREIGEDVSDEEFHRRLDAHLEWWRASYARAQRLRTQPPDSCLEDIIKRHRAKLESRPDDEIQTEVMHLETIGHHMFITRERARQLEAAAWKLLGQAAPRLRRALYDAEIKRGLLRKVRNR